MIYYPDQIVQVIEPVRLPDSSTSPVANSPNPVSALTPFTRREFYQLAQRCREYALELAGYDQSRVNLQQCQKFNAWLSELKVYQTLGPAIRTLTPARLIARWQVMTLAVVIGLGIMLFLASRAVRAPIFFSLYTFGLIILYFVPERFYGTTVEMLEGKVLRIVDALDAVLASGKMEFTEAAFFQVKENLTIARHELRQQIDLAHRRW